MLPKRWAVTVVKRRVPGPARGSLETMAPLALSNGEVILVIVAAVIPIAAVSFALSGDAFRSIGRGGTALEEGRPPPPEMISRELEIRQMVEAKAYRQAQRGGPPLDVEAEIARLRTGPGAASLRRDRELVAEVRALVEARNARRRRQGEEPLDVEAEVARRLDDLERTR